MILCLFWTPRPPRPFPLLIPSASYLEMPFHCSSIFQLLPLYYGYTWEVHIMPRGKVKILFNKINQKFILGSIKNKHTNKNTCIVRILQIPAEMLISGLLKCMFAHTFNLSCTLTLYLKSLFILTLLLRSHLPVSFLAFSFLIARSSDLGEFYFRCLFPVGKSKNHGLVSCYHLLPDF